MPVTNKRWTDDEEQVRRNGQSVWALLAAAFMQVRECLATKMATSFFFLPGLPCLDHHTQIKPPGEKKERKKERERENPPERKNQLHGFLSTGYLPAGLVFRAARCPSKAKAMMARWQDGMGGQQQQQQQTT